VRSLSDYTSHREAVGKVEKKGLIDAEDVVKDVLQEERENTAIKFILLPNPIKGVWQHF